MKKVLYVLNDCMRKFSHERASGLYRALLKLDEPFNLYILRIDAFSDFAIAHNFGEYNIFRLPDYGEFDGILLDINSAFDFDSPEYDIKGFQYVAKAAAESGAPVISMANHIPGFHFVGIDNHDAMTAVIRHLHQNHGLMDFWFAMGPVDNYENQLRLKGLMDYCLAHDLPCGEDRLYQESYIIESGFHAFNELYARHGGRLPQAVVCANDHIAMGVCHAAEAAGFNVPEDFLLTGFDNSEIGAAFTPAITTVDQQTGEMGDVCVDALRRIWRGEDVPEMLNIPTKFVPRESTERTPPPLREAARPIPDYVGNPMSNTDFTYKISAMQYRLPGCRSIEEICQALVDCVSALSCDGMDLVLDSRLFDAERALSFTEQIGQVREVGSDLCVEGYPDTLELVFQWEKGKPPRYPRLRLDDRLSALPLEGSRDSYLFAPLHFMERTVGYLCMRNCLDILRIKAVSIIVSTLTMSLRTYFSAQRLSYINRVLSGVSMKDGLTGLYNRLGYHELAYTLYKDLSDRGGRLAILFLDMDRLKVINDVYGHGVGDRAIQCVAAAIRQGLPGDAIPVRYGGDEFLVLIPDADEAALARRLDAVAAAIADHAARLDLPEVPGVSAGHVIVAPSDARSLDSCVQAADALMYAHKKAKKAQRT